MPPSPTPETPPSLLLPRLQPPLCLSSSLSMREVAKKMADVRTDAAILLDAHGQLEGILSDHDVARYVRHRTFRRRHTTFN